MDGQPRLNAGKCKGFDGVASHQMPFERDAIELGIRSRAVDLWVHRPIHCETSVTRTIKRKQKLPSKSKYFGIRRSSDTRLEDIKRLSTIGREDVAVPVPLVALYPSFGNGRIFTALEVVVSDLKEVMSPENTRDGYSVFGEHRKNLTRCNVSINCLNCHGTPLREEIIGA